MANTLNQKIAHFRLEFNPAGSRQAAVLAATRLSRLTARPAEQIGFDPIARERLSAMPATAARTAFIGGRLCADCAAGLLVGKTSAPIRVDNGCFGQPFFPDLPGLELSISHCADWAAALVFPAGQRLGLDLEESIAEPETVNVMLSPNENELLSAIGAQEAATLAWVAREALAKATTCGYLSPPEIYALSSISVQPYAYQVDHRFFPQFRTQVLTAAGLWLAISYPQQQSLPDLAALAGWLRELTANS